MCEWCQSASHGPPQASWSLNVLEFCRCEQLPLCIALWDVRGAFPLLLFLYPPRPDCAPVGSPVPHWQSVLHTAPLGNGAAALGPE